MFLTLQTVNVIKCFQSLVMAVQMRDLDALLQLEDHLVPHLSPDPRQLNLLRILVTAVRDKDQP